MPAVRAIFLILTFREAVYCCTTVRLTLSVMYFMSQYRGSKVIYLFELCPFMSQYQGSKVTYLFELYPAAKQWSWKAS